MRVIGEVLVVHTKCESKEISRPSGGGGLRPPIHPLPLDASLIVRLMWWTTLKRECVLVTLCTKFVIIIIAIILSFYWKPSWHSQLVTMMYQTTSCHAGQQCILEHKALSCRPSIQRNITHRLSQGIRLLWSGTFTTMLCNLFIQTATTTNACIH